MQAEEGPDLKPVCWEENPGLQCQLDFLVSSTLAANAE